MGGRGITMFPSSCSVWPAATPGGGQRATAAPPEAYPPEGVGGPAASLWGPLPPVLVGPPLRTAPWARGGRAGPGGALWWFPGHVMRSNRSRAQASVTGVQPAVRLPPPQSRCPAGWACLVQKAPEGRLALTTPRPGTPGPAPAPWKGPRRKTHSASPGEQDPGPGGADGALTET